MKTWPYAMLTFLCLTAGHAVARPAPTAIFAFELINTSPQRILPEEESRLLALDLALQDAIAHSSCCSVVDMTAVTDQAKSIDMPSCNGCELVLARKVGATISVTGWVQKVSNLILNINVVVHDVATGRVINAGSVDIRGNTDQTWLRGLSYLVRNRLNPSDW